MDDLIARATKYARSGGRTGTGQYRAAERDERSSQILSWTSAALTAVVGTSIFTQWVQTYAVPLGLLAMLASALSAIQSASKLAELAASTRPLPDRIYRPAASAFDEAHPEYGDMQPKVSR